MIYERFVRQRRDAVCSRCMAIEAVRVRVEGHDQKNTANDEPYLHGPTPSAPTRKTIAATAIALL